LTPLDWKCYNLFCNYRRFFAEDKHYHVAVTIAIVTGNDCSFGGKRMKYTIKVSEKLRNKLSTFSLSEAPYKEISG